MFQVAISRLMGLVIMMSCIIFCRLVMIFSDEFFIWCLYLNLFMISNQSVQPMSSEPNQQAGDPTQKRLPLPFLWFKIISWSCLFCGCWSWSALFCVSSAYILLLDFVIFLQCLKNCAKFSLEKVITVSCDQDETGDFVGGGGFLPMAHFLDTHVDVRGWAHDDGGGARELQDDQTK